MTKKINQLLTVNEALSLSWKQRKDYKGYDKSKGSMYNSWRSKVYTQKGKKIGFPDKWKTFDGFKEDVGESWGKNKILIRLDRKLPFSISNYRWGERGEECTNRLLKLEYNGEIKTLFDWSVELDLNYNGLLQRYHTGKDYTNEQILFGKRKKKRCSPRDYKSMNYQEKRDKISKMLSAYKNKDNRRGYEYNLTREFLENIMESECVYCGTRENVGTDRKDNNRGHVMDNCVPCCFRCNSTRNNNFTHEEMKILGHLIKQIDENRIKKENS